ERIANDGLYQARLRDKRRRRALDERVKPLQAYRDEELAACRECFVGPDRAYHEARRRFVYKLGESGASTPDPMWPAALPGGPLPTRSSVERPHVARKDRRRGDVLAHGPKSPQSARSR